MHGEQRPDRVGLPYQFELLLGAPTHRRAGSPYIYYSRASDLIRTPIATGTVEPILLPNGFAGGIVIAGDTVRGKLYHPGLPGAHRPGQPGRQRRPRLWWPTPTPTTCCASAESLAVDERSGRIYWVQPATGVVGNIMSANGDGSRRTDRGDRRRRSDHGMAVDPVGGRLYWAQTTLLNSAVVDHIRRSNLDGTDVETVYAAPEGRQIRELTVDPFAQTLYWRDPTQNRLLRTAADGSGARRRPRHGGRCPGLCGAPAAGRTLLHSRQPALARPAGRQQPGGRGPAGGRVQGRQQPGHQRLLPDGHHAARLQPGPGLQRSLRPAVQRVDGYEPNNTLATAAAITPGTLSAALCTPDLANVDLYDYYSLTVASGQQITVTLSDLPSRLQPGPDGRRYRASPGAMTRARRTKSLTHINRSGAPVVYTILVLRSGAIATAACPTASRWTSPWPRRRLPRRPRRRPTAARPIDVYDQPGVLGNQTRATATDISFNETITAALCYSGDKDAYAFTGAVGQNVKIDLPVRPADYYISVYNPDGQYVTGIFPGSWLHYGDSLHPQRRRALDPHRLGSRTWSPTTSQYELLLSINTACTGLDPYEPNNDSIQPRR